LLRPESHGLERRRKQRPAVHTHKSTKPRDPGSRPGQPIESGVGQLDVGEEHVRLQGGISEQKIEELRWILRRGGQRLGDGHSVLSAFGQDPLYPAHDLLDYAGIAQGGPGQLDGLLQQQGFGARLDLPSIRPHQIGHPNGGIAHAWTVLPALLYSGRPGI
jgi:hypothetical protein